MLLRCVPPFFVIILCLGVYYAMRRSVELQRATEYLAPNTDRMAIVLDTPTRFEMEQNKHNKTTCQTDSTPYIHVNTILRDNSSWGKRRTYQDYLALLLSLDYPFACIQLNLLVSERKAYESIRNASIGLAPYLELGRLVVMRESGDTSSAESPSGQLRRAVRHDPKLQKERRARIARLRNMLLYSTIGASAQGVLWIDADMSGYPPHLLRDIVASKRDIVISQCNDAEERRKEYDLNTWASANGRNRQRYLGKDYPDAGDSRFVEITSVGGTFLYVKADIHRYGVAFPPYYVIGVCNWEIDGGYDGLETEGLCFVAKKLGYQCWGMPQSRDRVYH